LAPRLGNLFVVWRTFGSSLPFAPWRDPSRVRPIPAQRRNGRCRIDGADGLRNPGSRVQPLRPSGPNALIAGKSMWVHPAASSSACQRLQIPRRSVRRLDRPAVCIGGRFSWLLFWVWLTGRGCVRRVLGSCFCVTLVAFAGSNRFTTHASIQAHDGAKVQA